jgi:hypothetical protein
MDSTERIDRYLSGMMDEQERLDFEAEAASDPALAESLALQRDMEAFLQGKSRREARQQQLRALGLEYFKPEQGSAKTATLPRRRLLWLAAAAAAAVIALILTWPSLFGPSLYEQYAQHPPLALAEKSTDGLVDWSATEAAFNTGDYTAAAAQLEQYLAQQPEDELARLYLGISALELDRIEEARHQFLSLAAADAAVKDYADWYLALSFLKTGDEERCRELLRAISPDSALFTRAAGLLQQLD